MPDADRQTTSVWAGREQPAVAALTGDIAADVCVIGAGIAGVTTAYLLASEGRQVVLVDAAHPGAGETSRTSAHLASELDDRYSALERQHGAEVARLAAESHSAAITRIERIIAAESIACDFTRVDGYLFAGEGDSPELLREECAAAQRAGLAGVELVDEPFPLLGWLGPCVRFPQQAQFDPLRYLAGLVAAAQRKGAKVFGGVRVTDIHGGASFTLPTQAGPVITAGAVIVATNEPLTRLALHTKLAPYRTYAIAAAVPRDSVPRALYWDTSDPYHYVRLAPGESDHEELLIVGGEDHKTGQGGEASSAFVALEGWAARRFPLTRVTHRWSGQVLETLDGLAYIGRLAEHEECFVVTGDSGMGMTHGTIAGMVLTDSVQGRRNRWAHIYAPDRKPLASAMTFARENLNVARQYLDWARVWNLPYLDALPANSGTVVYRGLDRIAVYRDEAGRFHRCSAVCPHLGCIVAWNAVEHTWDCPCHGSRFEALGGLINGPATRGLESLDHPAIVTAAPSKKSASPAGP